MWLKFAGWLVLTAALCAQEAPAGWSGFVAERGWWNGRAVEYRVVDGLAIAEGDIILGPVEELRRPPDEVAGKGRGAVVIVSDTFRWTDNVVIYLIDPGLPDQDRVRLAIKEWEEKTPFRFVERTDQRNFVRFRRGSGCSSSVGMRGGEQFINLADACSLGNTIHEIGHTLGLYHTQSRLDRDLFLRVLYTNIDRREWSQFDQRLNDGADIGPYDFASIMHYTWSAFSRNFRPVFETTPPGIPIGQRDTLSPGDIYAASRLTGVRMEEVVVDTNPSGLPVTVDGETFVAPKTFRWNAGERHVISAPSAQELTNARFRFARWSDGGEAEHSITVGDDTRIYVAHHSASYRIRTAVSPADGGSIEISPASEDNFYPAGSRVSIRATPAEGFRLVNFVPGAGGVTIQGASGLGLAANPSEITVDRDILFYTAQFTQLPVTTIASEPPGAAVIVDGLSVLTPRSYLWAPGTSHTLRAAPNQTIRNGTVQLRFDRWKDQEGGTLNITAGDESAGYTALLQRQHLLTLNTDWIVNGALPTRPGLSNFTVDPPSLGGFYDDGTEVSITASTRDGEGYFFTHWTGDAAGTNASRTIRMTDQRYVLGTFVTPPFLASTSMVHDGSQQPLPGLAPGQVAWIYSHQIGPEEPVRAVRGADGNLPLSLVGVRVLISGEAAPLLSLERNRIRFAAPNSLAVGTTVQVVVDNNGQRSNVRTHGIVSANPGIYTPDGSGLGSLSSRELSRGEMLTIPVSGLGMPGESRLPSLPLQVRIAGSEVPVESIVPAADGSPGLFEVRVRIPDGAPNGVVAVEVFAGGRPSQPGVTVTIAPGA